MCGIVGYVGGREALPVLLDGLERLEYRGYDSCGVALAGPGGLVVQKTTGRVADLRESIQGVPPDTTGIGHTRWATHGAPTFANAHPHTDALGRVAVAHNGIIENHDSIRDWLGREGTLFASETDTEALAQLIGRLYRGDLEDAVRSALHEVEGTYGLVVVCAAEPGVVVAAKKGSPLLIGVGDGEHIVASDASAVLEHTKQVVYLDDGEVARITATGFTTTTLDASPVTKEVQEIGWTLDQIELGGHKHFMSKEIFEQPGALRDSMRGRIDVRRAAVRLGGIRDFAGRFGRARRVVLTGCGTAWHAALVGEYLFEAMAKVPTEVEYASEFRYRNPVVDQHTTVIAVSQSGETADTLAAVQEAKRLGALALGAVNVVGSTIARETDAGVYLHVGPEIGVASTKAFTGQVAVLAMLAAHLGRRKRRFPKAECAKFLGALAEIPSQTEDALRCDGQAKDIAERLADRDNWLYLGRGYNYPVALEGALKLKEISYIHAEGLPAAEMKHGPIALISDGMPVVFLATRGAQYEKIVGNIEEVRARGGHIIAVATVGDDRIGKLADDVIYVPDAPEPLQPLLTVIPLQLIAYHAAVARGCDVDKPRNLAKSVTVE